MMVNEHNNFCQFCWEATVEALGEPEELRSNYLTFQQQLGAKIAQNEAKQARLVRENPETALLRKCTYCKSTVPRATREVLIKQLWRVSRLTRYWNTIEVPLKPVRAYEPYLEDYDLRDYRCGIDPTKSAIPAVVVESEGESAAHTTDYEGSLGE